LPSSRPRTGTMQEARLKVGDRVLFWDPEAAEAAPTRPGAISVPLPGLSEFGGKLAPRQAMWFCDGRLDFAVEEANAQHVLARLVRGEVPLKSSNSLFLPEAPGAFTIVTSADRDLLKALAGAGVSPDWIALSLVCSADDVHAASKEVRDLMPANVKIMAKFETSAAIECAEEIIDVADGIMVARGDLALAVGYGRLPGVQEDLVEAGRQAGKEVIVATQVLEVFAETGVPQRAELTDLAVVARQQASGIMLGKETVFSPRPIECIRFAREVMACEVQRLEARAAGVGGLAKAV